MIKNFKKILSFLQAPYLILLLLAATVRVLHWAADPMIARDGVFYLRAGEAFFKHKSYHIGSPALYENLIALGMYFPSIPLQLWAQLISMIVGTMLPLIGYFGCKNFFKNSRDALFVGIFLAIFPPFVIYSHQVLQESLFAFFIIGGIAGVMRGLYPQCRWQYFVLDGFLAAGATCTQWGGVLLPAILLLFLLGNVLLSREQRKAYGIALLSFSASFILWCAFLQTFDLYPWSEIANCLRRVLC